MYAIKANEKKLNGQIVPTFERNVAEPRTVLKVEAGTTGYKGLCREAGGRTYFKLECRIGDFFFSPMVYKRNGKKEVYGIEIATCGDAGLEAITKALQFALDAINDQRYEAEV